MNPDPTALPFEELDDASVEESLRPGAGRVPIIACVIRHLDQADIHRNRL
jgi:hypothetical protein